MFIRALVIAALVRLLIATEKPLLCAVLYTVVSAVTYLAFSHSFVDALLGVGIGFGLSYVYFLALNRVREGLLWWVILVAGIAIGFV